MGTGSITWTWWRTTRTPFSITCGIIMARATRLPMATASGSPAREGSRKTFGWGTSRRLREPLIAARTALLVILAVLLLLLALLFLLLLLFLARFFARRLLFRWLLNDARFLNGWRFTMGLRDWR